MKFRILLLVALIVTSYSAISQTLYVPSGTSGIGSSSTANIGIGISNPSIKFQVVAPANGMKARFQGTDGYIDIGPSNSSYAHIYTDRPYFLFNKPIWAWDGKFSSYNTSDLFLQTNNNTRLTILNSNGNVGIGGTPYAKLHVYAEGDPEFAEYDSRNGFQIWGTDQALYMGACTNKRVSYIQSVDKGTSESTLAFNVRGGAVTVGTINANGYQFAVNGGILCESIYVQLDVPSSDYVFESNYKLNSLKEIETFIKINKHLPEVPSAQYFKDNGYNLGEMDDILLRKVEELTLYLIELNKRIEILETENVQLKAKAN